MFYQIFFNPLQGVWMPDKTLFRVFEIASQTGENEEINSPKTTKITTGYQNLLHSSEFSCVFSSLMTIWPYLIIAPFVFKLASIQGHVLF